MDKSVFCVLAFKEQKRKKVCILFASSRKCKNILKIIRESPGKAGEFIGIVRIIKIIIYKFIWIKKIKEKKTGRPLKVLLECTCIKML